MLPVLVTDKDGKFADGLRKEDFVLRVGRARVDVDTFDRDESRPSRSPSCSTPPAAWAWPTSSRTPRTRSGPSSKAGKPGDDFALFAFSEGEVRLVADFSADPTKLSRELWELEASGQTALFDAVAATPERMMRGRNNKRAILLFTDGVDNASELSAAEDGRALATRVGARLPDRHEEPRPSTP